MEIVLCVIGIILCIVGVIGSVLPGIPGPQLTYLAILLAQLFMNQPFSRRFTIVRGILIILLTIADYYLPILGTKKFGGSKQGNRGCMIGIVVGIFAGPFGLILGPFAGALIGEYLHQSNIQQSIKPAFGAFIGFISGVLLKLIVSIILFVYFCISCYQHFFPALDPISVQENEITTLL